MTRFALVALAALCLAPRGWGQCATTPTFTSRPRTTVAVAPHVVKKEVVTVVEAALVVPTVATYIQIPLYTAVYVPSYTPPVVATASGVAPGGFAPQAAPVAAALPQAGQDRILALLERMDARIAALEGGSPRQPAPLAAPRGADVRPINAAKCAMCHQQGSEGKGGDFVLSDLAGGIVQMSEAQLVSLEGHINAGTMPKLTAASRAAGVTPLTADEKTAWVEEIRRQRKR